MLDENRARFACCKHRTGDHQWDPLLFGKSYAEFYRFLKRLAPLVRFAADPGDPDGFRAVVAPGQSEHPRSAHYTDGIEPWRQGRLLRVPFSEARLAESTTQRLVLEPSQ